MSEQSVPQPADDTRVDYTENGGRWIGEMMPLPDKPELTPANEETSG